MGRIAFHLFAQPIDMDGDGRRTAHGIQLPDAVIQRLLAEDDLRMLREKEQEIKLACCKNHLVSPKKYAPRLRLNLKRAKKQDNRRPYFLNNRGIASTGESCTDPSSRMALPFLYPLK